MYQSRQQHFAEAKFVGFLDPRKCKNTFLCLVLYSHGDNYIVL